MLLVGVFAMLWGVVTFDLGVLAFALGVGVMALGPVGVGLWYEDQRARRSGEMPAAVRSDEGRFPGVGRYAWRQGRRGAALGFVLLGLFFVVMGVVAGPAPYSSNPLRQDPLRLGIGVVVLTVLLELMGALLMRKDDQEANEDANEDHD